jgi:hypothetical protein
MKYMMIWRLMGTWSITMYSLKSSNMLNYLIGFGKCLEDYA